MTELNKHEPPSDAEDNEQKVSAEAAVEGVPGFIWISPKNAALYARPESQRDPNDTVQYARVSPIDEAAVRRVAEKFVDYACSRTRMHCLPDVDKVAEIISTELSVHQPENADQGEMKKTAPCFSTVVVSKDNALDADHPCGGTLIQNPNVHGEYSWPLVCNKCGLFHDDEGVHTLGSRCGSVPITQDTASPQERNSITVPDLSPASLPSSSIRKTIQSLTNESGGIDSDCIEELTQRLSQGDEVSKEQQK